MISHYLPTLILASGFTIGLIVFSFPQLAIWILLVSIMIITGCVGYVSPAFNKISWANVIIIAIFSFKVLLFSKKEKFFQKKIIPLPLIFILMFALYCLLAMVTNTFFKESITASKNIIQFLSLPFILYFGKWAPKNVESYMKFFLVVALITPFIIVIQKYIFGAGYDQITGTFGSSYLAPGGPNAVMSIYLVSQIAALLFLSKYSYIPWGLTTLLSLFLLYGLTFTMAQSILGFLLIMSIFVIKDYKLKQFKKFFMLVFLFCTLFFILLNSYFNTTKDRLNNSLYMSPPKSYADYIKLLVNTNFSPDIGDLNRTGLVFFWYRFNINNNNYLQLIFGHGLGATKKEGLEVGHIQRLFRDTKIGRTALASMLWEVGILGTILYLCIYVSSFWLSKNLNKIRLPGIHQAFMKSAQLNCIFFIFSIPYKFSIIENQAFNFYSFFVIGYICYWHKQIYMDKFYVKESTFRKTANAPPQTNMFKLSFIDDKTIR